MFQIKANYMLMIDNLMDLTHLGYVHNRTIGGDPNTHVTADMETRPTENGAYFIRWLPGLPAAADLSEGAAGSRGASTGGRSSNTSRRASCCNGRAVSTSDAARARTANQKGFHLRLLHGATPETETTFHYFWSTSNGYRQEEPQATQEMYDEIYPTFIEDKTIMEAQQERLDLDPDRSLVPINADGALALARIAIDRLIAQEQATVAQAAE